MPRIVWPYILAAVAGCDLGPPPPAVLQETEFKSRVQVEAAEPVDPQSVLFTLHKSGQVTWKGTVQSPEEMVRRIPQSGEVNRTPILFEVEPDAPIAVVGNALGIFVRKIPCVNYSLLVHANGGSGVVLLPMRVDKGSGYHVCEGRDKEVQVGKYPDGEQLEIVVYPGKGGKIDVREINYVVPGTIAFPSSEAEASWKARQSWKGDHPPYGVWTKDMLRTFLSKPDVVDRIPYIHFKVTNQESFSEVVRCLAVLRAFKDVPIVPSIPMKP